VCLGASEVGEPVPGVERERLGKDEWNNYETGLDRGKEVKPSFLSFSL